MLTLFQIHKMTISKRKNLKNRDHLKILKVENKNLNL